MTKQEKIEKVVTFIKNNSLLFGGAGSGLNSDCTVISGYALYIGINDPNELLKGIRKGLDRNRLTDVVNTELRRVFNFAKDYNYGNWWNTPRAQSEWRF